MIGEGEPGVRRHVNETSQALACRTPDQQRLVSSDESLGEAARHARQRKACFELMKDNPSIACN